MPEKPKALPPPPEGQSAFASTLTGLRNLLGIGPVAYSRITRTPIYTDSLPKSIEGQYNPTTQNITLNPGGLDSDPWEPGKTYYHGLIPHESAHALYQKAGLDPAALRTSELGTTALMRILDRPDIYTSDPKTIANEGLAYSIGTEKGTPYVLQVVSQIKDPEIAKQLMRLHYNALASKNPQR